ncbi:MAG: RES domain-containing protein [Chloroflexia bacterium]|nr:RES domain-containing protein [Chloroflexia bacterium]
MRVDPFLISIDQLVYRTIPDAPNNNPLDPLYAALTDRNRRGEPTLYLGGDPRVMATEWARHVEDEIKDPAIAGEQRYRRTFDVRASLDRVLDVRDPALCRTLSLQNAPWCFADSKRLCQQTSSRLRQQTDARAIIVPAIGLIDQPDRWVLVVFTDKLPTYPEPFLTDLKADGTLPAWLAWNRTENR